MKIYHKNAASGRSGSAPLHPDRLRSLLETCSPDSGEIILLCIGTDRIIGDSLGPLVGSMVERSCHLHPFEACRLQPPLRYQSQSQSQFQTRLLSEASPQYRLTVYGTLESTVHALNLEKISMHIKKKHPGSTVIAVDASLGSYESIGSVFIRSGGLRPGAGVRKSLPCIGDISITGISGEQSRHPYLALQTVRLSTVTQMAELISGCILCACTDGSSG